MSLLSPWMLLGLLTATVPVVIHLIGRRRARRQPFAAVEFLLASNRKMARRLHLRQWLLLILRALLLGVLALMMAKPVFETTAQVPEMAAGAQSTVIVLDDTLSMARRVADETVFERAKRRARSLVTQSGGAAHFALLSVSRPAGPVAALVRDQRRIWAAIDESPQTFEHATLEAAITQAAGLLEQAELTPRRIVVLTDMAKHGLPKRLPAIPEGIGLHPIDVAPSGEAQNDAITSLETEGSPAPGHRSMAIGVRVCHFGRRRQATEVKLALDDRVIARAALTIEQGKCARKRFNHTFDAGGIHRVVVSLPGDDLPIDDRRYLRLEVQADVRALLVDGSPSPVRQRDELFYLEAALQAPAQRQRQIVSTLITPDQLDSERLSVTDVVLLCNVGKVQEGQAAALRRFVDGGGGLLISVGDNVDAEQLNERLGELLPQPLRGPAAAQGTARESALRLGGVDAEHPVLASLWSEQRGGGLRKARFSRVFRLQPRDSPSRRVLMRFDDGSPALLEARRGAGRVAFFASTVDRDWTDLPVRPGFAPLFQQLVRHLSGTPLDVPQREVRVGSTQSIAIEPGTHQLRLEAPEGEARSWAAADLRGREAVEVVADRPGFYRFSASMGDGFAPLTRQSFVANVDTAESVLHKGSLEPRRARDRRPPRVERQIELWHAVGLALLLLLLGEALLTRRG
jgi:hypothetical protein